ncbi:MAG: two pore domain potassium channel family protein [Halomonas sp.]|uniref:potassium channel family protein n=1 Tax=Halomonas sp. TaxID=1486246 RepID=UPI0019E9ACF5|nr:potassium channel family protein [Halomonas sp.]MBE0488127.1 two pore domain potassium channel family protein [Halomonas sp.]
MTDEWVDTGHLLVAGTTFAVVVACVLLHYEVAITLSRLMDKNSGTQRRRFLMLIFGLLGAHIAEIWLFGLAAWLLLDHPLAGSLAGFESLTFLDHVYLSAVTYTTLGYGDLVPRGHIRFLMGTEALTGFMLITWSASLTFIEMQKHWEGGR